MAESTDPDLRWREVPDDGAWYDIEARPLYISLQARCPMPPQRVRSLGERDAHDEQGYLYHRFDYPYGWTSAGHLAERIGDFFEELAYGPHHAYLRHRHG